MIYNYNTKDAAKTFEDKLGKVEKALDENLDWFVNLYDAVADEYDWFELAKELYRAAFGRELDWDRFNTGWQFRTVNCEDFNQAKIELIDIILGWW